MAKGPSKNYFKVKNDFWEALEIDFDIPNGERRVLGFVVRWTYGLKARDRMTLDRQKCAERLGVSRRHLKRLIGSLVKNQALICYEKGRRGQPGIYGPNADFSAWNYPKYGDTMMSPKLGGHHDVPKRAELGDTMMSPQMHPACPPISEASPHGYQPESLPERHVYKDMRSKDTPLTPQGKPGAEGDFSILVERIAQAIFKRLSEEYYGITGAPESKLELCRKLAQKYAGQPKRLQAKCREALQQQRALEEQTGERTRMPFRMLDRVDELMKKREAPEVDPPPFVDEETGT